MITYLLGKLGEWLERAEQRRREAHLSNAKDLADIERRMNYLDRNA
ncbi:DUF3563 family protein [Paraburkholderia humisilvae]|uniref:DUF3563 domain-containing protein n=1 Tax=Paraburkholderia humisilvae TaxID=627669 RepID=A0A6J5F6M4_9BURK|nr:DUF3563 family protein [Paraburkholderia humisilvae]CAB3772806.1 hypothetical protein LMG29542_06988 [Paraburkholderia humisilvae]